MMQLIIITAITSVLVLGWTVVTQPDMLLHSVRVWAEAKKSKWASLLWCHWCMPSVWSLFGYGFAVALDIIEINWKVFAAYPIVVCASSLICGFVWVLYRKLENQASYFENAEKLTYFDIKDRKMRHNSNKQKQDHG